MRLPDAAYERAVDGLGVEPATEDKHFSRAQARRVVRRMDDRGLGTTGTVGKRAVGAVGD